MAKSPLNNAADRIAFSEAADYLEQGRADLIAPHLVALYLEHDLMVRDGDSLRLSDAGLALHQSVRRERFTDG